MTTYLGEKAVGIGTVKAEIGVTGVVLHDETLVGNGNTEPLGVNTENIVSQQTLANTVSILNNDIQKTFENSVKKSGDTMTGILTIQAEEDYDPSTPPVGGLSFKSNASPVEFTNRMRQVGNGFIAIEYLLNGKQYSNLVFGDQEIYIDNTENETGNPVSLGTSGNPWDNVYAKKLNNGADISVPTLGGTLARIEDIQNATATLNAGITGNAQAIQKTREDYIQADSEIHQILNSHAGELTTLKNNQGALGDQVSNIESKIPESASDTNPLVTKQQLLDEEMDIRDDYNEMVSELQTQITAQAGAIAGKQDELTAGEGIKIENNVISATGGGGSGSANVVHDSTLTGAGTSASPLGLSEAVKDEIADKAPKETVETLTTAVNDIYTGLSGKQDKLTAGENITIEDGVISATGGGGELPDNVLVNNATGTMTISIGGTGTGNYSLCVGKASSANAFGSTALGFGCVASAMYAIQLGNSGRAVINSDANTLKVANGNGNFEMMSADGTIPAARHATLPTEDGTYVLKCVISGGVPTMTWVKE